MYIYIYIYINNNLIGLFIYLQMSTNINSTTRHLRFSYVSILTNLLRTDNETKCVETIYN